MTKKKREILNNLLNCEIAEWVDELNKRGKFNLRKRSESVCVFEDDSKGSRMLAVLDIEPLSSTCTVWVMSPKMPIHHMTIEWAQKVEHHLPEIFNLGESLQSRIADTAAKLRETRKPLPYGA